MSDLPAQLSIQSLEGTLAALQDKHMSLEAFCLTWRGASTLLSALPPRYQLVMEDLLGRLESGSQFTEESCSYSQEDLLANLADWLEKAQASLSPR